MNVIIIGSGPAGLNCAIHSSSNKNDVLIIEKNEKPGKKLFITGKGRCNVTNDSTNEEFISNVVSNPRFLYSSIKNFNCRDTIDFFENRNIPLVIERGKRVFPKSYKSYDITDGLVKECHKLGVKINYNEKVTNIFKEEDHFIVSTTKGTYKANYVVIATGGLSYPLTGSSGDGYKFARNFNHTIVDTVPSLVGLRIKEEVYKELEEFTLKNISLNVTCNKYKHSEFGELTFYKNYLDGPIAITTSSYINRFNVNDAKLELDLKPALSDEVLLNRINRDINKKPNTLVLDLLRGLLPREFMNFFINNTNIDINEKCTNFSSVKRKELVQNLKHFKLTYLGLESFDRAIVTAGGISTKEIIPSTMESKLIPNLYFAGEVIDVDALTGGFNIQIALSTGALAGDDINNKINGQ